MGAKHNPGDRRRYNKPPAQHQFAKGQSGNPGGRSKGSRNFGSVLARIADSEMQMRLDGRTVTVTVVEAVIWKLMQEALKGDLRAIQASLGHFERLDAANEDAANDGPKAEPGSTGVTPAHDLATLARYRDQITRRAAAEGCLDARGAATSDPDTDDRDDDVHAEADGDADADALPEGRDHA